MQHDHSVKQGRIAVIGEQRREFRPVLITLAEIATRRKVTWLPTIESALENGVADSGRADLIIVLQSWSDQYSDSATNALIGATLGKRLLCCYGPWCESDGRNRSCWPDSVRVAVRLASGMIVRELADCEHNRPAIPLTAARDELFTHRLGIPDYWQPLSSDQSLNAAIVGPDRILRRTLAMGLADLGIRSLNSSLFTIRNGETVALKETSRGPVHILLHDLDPWSSMVEASINAASQAFPDATVFGIAHMPDAGLATELADTPLHSVIPKLDLELGLRQHLRRWQLLRDVA